jgi:hypothetical protein
LEAREHQFELYASEIVEIGFQCMIVDPLEITDEGADTAFDFRLFEMTGIDPDIDCTAHLTHRR